MKTKEQCRRADSFLALRFAELGQLSYARHETRPDYGTGSFFRSPVMPVTLFRPRRPILGLLITDTLRFDLEHHGIVTLLHGRDGGFGGRDILRDGGGFRCLNRCRLGNRRGCRSGCGSRSTGCGRCRVGRDGCGLRLLDHRSGRFCRLLFLSRDRSRSGGSRCRRG